MMSENKRFQKKKLNKEDGKDVKKAAKGVVRFIIQANRQLYFQQAV